MKEKTKDCYLCENHKAKRLYHDISERDKTIYCQDCGKYILYNGALLLYFERDDGEELSENCKKKVRKYVVDNYKDKPVKITKKVMRTLCPKASMKINIVG